MSRLIGDNWFVTILVLSMVFLEETVQVQELKYVTKKQRPIDLKNETTRWTSGPKY